MTRPITPPPELVQQWSTEAEQNHDPKVAYSLVIGLANRAAQWGADQELEACVAWLDGYEREGWAAQELRAARRPKPPSLKEQALEQLDGIAAVFRMSHGGDIVCDKIRCALEALDD